MPPLALIIGDSQAQGAGAYLQKELEAKGYKVTRDYKAGGDWADVAAKAVLHLEDKPDLVVVFSGSVGGDGLSVKTVASQWPSAKKVWYGSSPATHILSLPDARAKFGKKVAGPDYWLTSGEAKQREERNAQLKQLVSQAGITYVDWRDLQLPGAVQQLPGVMFPSQQDGIHVLGATAQAAFVAPNWPNGSASAATAPQSGHVAILALIVFAIIMLRR